MSKLLPLETFLTAFWPNMLATLVGVVVGVPVALCLNRLQEERGNAAQAQHDSQQRRSIIKLLLKALRHNARELERLADILDSGGVPTAVDIQSEAWTAIRSDALRLIEFPHVRAELATHFEAAGGLSGDIRQQATRLLSRSEIPQYAVDELRNLEGEIMRRSAQRARSEAAAAKALAQQLS